MASLTVTLNITYPCHAARQVRLAATRYVPIERYERTCPTCGLQWTIERRTSSDKPGVRVDIVDWEIA